jgi:spore germination protein PD
MKMDVNNRKLRIGHVAIQSIDAASLVQFGDAETVTTSSLTDTPADSLIIAPMVPLVPPYGGGGAHSA